jgi:hypothetical protein
LISIVIALLAEARFGAISSIATALDFIPNQSSFKPGAPVIIARLLVAAAQ